MRKFMLFFAVAGLMIFTLSVSALGATQLYLDYIASGDLEDDDLSGFIAGLDYQLNEQFKIGAEHLVGVVDFGSDDADYNQTLIKGGYKIIENIYATLTYADAEYDGWRSEIYFNGLLIGAEVDYELAENITFNGSFGISITGEYEVYGSSSGDADISILKMKLNYLFCDTMGASFGYNSISADGDGEIEINYLTLGAVYKF